MLMRDDESISHDDASLGRGCVGHGLSWLGRKVLARDEHRGGGGSRWGWSIGLVGTAQRSRAHVRHQLRWLGRWGLGGDEVGGVVLVVAERARSGGGV